MSYLIFKEEKLKTAERNQLPDSEFGIPSLRKFPLNDETRVRQAIRFFHTAPPEHKKELAQNILKKMKQYNISESSIGNDNELRKYL